MPASSSRRLAHRASAGLGAAALALAGVAVPLGAAHAADPGDEVTLLAFNDFHGALDAGDAFACTVTGLRAQHPSSVLISAGDNVGGSAFASAVANDEPTIDFLNALGVDAGAIGNHEYDQGLSDLTERIAPGTDFPDLAANVYAADGTRVHDPYAIVEADGVRVAVVGAVTTKTVGKVSPAAIEGLTFGDPVEGVNDAVAELEASGEEYDVLVASYHEGASGSGEAGAAPTNSDPIFDSIVEGTSPEVDAILGGDSHQSYAYHAPVPGQDGEVRPIVQTGASGEALGAMTLALGEDGDWDVVEGGTALHPTESADLGACAGDETYEAAAGVAEQALADAEVAGSVPVGSVAGDITTSWDSSVAEYEDGARVPRSPVSDQASTKGDDRSRHSAAGSMLADSMAWYLDERGTAGDSEVIGFMNPGGIRAELWEEAAGGEGDGVVTYAEANSMVPFGNTLNTGEVTGAQFEQMLEEQWQRDGSGAPTSEFLAFSVSENVEYVYEPSREVDDRILEIRINGERIDPEATYTIVTASFLFEGGDNMWALSEATNVQDTGVLDRDAFVEYLGAHEDLAPDFSQRQLELQVLEAGEYDAEAGVDTDPVLRLGGLESPSLGAPEITSVVLDAGEHGTFEAPYDVVEDSGELAADVTLEDWLCVPEGTEVPVSITAVPDTGTDIVLDIPSFTWTAGGAPEDCGDDQGTEPPAEGDEETTPPPAEGDDEGTTPPPAEDEGTTPPPAEGDDEGTSPPPAQDDDEGATPPAADGDSGTTPPPADDDAALPAPAPEAEDPAGDDTAAGSESLARTGATVWPLAAAAGALALAGAAALALRRHLRRR
ncbi:5'-nucleotidase C-terminal domain-containing protein [Brachybacterium sp. YJGR34]|uniref:5'-nucleotidase C-terminal domain-containing protein n=1 Tax=Brachybacterium sp. YJGR34 TaxID=2059911 RepID=UPI000E0B0107|nr:5'-nucleotidase C-terminal domain-containing protein [Brachybacterium sp. YJGR34]